MVICEMYSHRDSFLRLRSPIGQGTTYKNSLHKTSSHWSLFRFLERDDVVVKIGILSQLPEWLGSRDDSQFTQIWEILQRHHSHRKMVKHRLIFSNSTFNLPETSQVQHVFGIAYPSVI